MAAHQGTYHCYLTAWTRAAHLFENVVQPLLHLQRAAVADGREEADQGRLLQLQKAVWGVFTASVGADEEVEQLETGK